MKTRGRTYDDNIETPPLDSHFTRRSKSKAATIIEDVVRRLEEDVQQTTSEAPIDTVPDETNPVPVDDRDTDNLPTSVELEVKPMSEVFVADGQADTARKSTAGNVNDSNEPAGTKQDVDHHDKGPADRKSSKPTSKPKPKSKTKHRNEKPSSKSSSKHRDDLSVSSRVSRGSRTPSGSEYSYVSSGHRRDSDSRGDRYDRDRSHYSDRKRDKGRKVSDKRYRGRSRSRDRYRSRSRSRDRYDDRRYDSRYYHDDHYYRNDYRYRSSQQASYHQPPQPPPMPPGFPPIPSQSARQAIDRQHSDMNKRYGHFVQEYNRAYENWYSIDNNSDHYKSYVHNMDNIFANNYHNEDQLEEAANLFVKSIRPSVPMPPPPRVQFEQVEDSKPPAEEVPHDTSDHNVDEVAGNDMVVAPDGGGDGGSMSSDDVSDKGHRDGYYQKVSWNPLHPYEAMRYTKEIQSLRRALYLCEVPDAYHVGIITLGGVNTIETFGLMSMTRWTDLAKLLAKNKPCIFLNDKHQRLLVTLSLWARVRIVYGQQEDFDSLTRKHVAELTERNYCVSKPNN